MWSSRGPVTELTLPDPRLKPADLLVVKPQYTSPLPPCPSKSQELNVTSGGRMEAMDGSK